MVVNIVADWRIFIAYNTTASPQCLWETFFVVVKKGISTVIIAARFQNIEAKSLTCIL
jgi:hypothetical protein